MASHPVPSKYCDRLVDWAIYGALAIVSLVLLWGQPYLPQVDEPMVAYSARIYHLLRQGDADVAVWHGLRGGVTHRAYYELLHWFQWVTSVRVAQRLVLTIAVLGIPVVARWFCRVHGRCSVQGLAAFSVGLGYLMGMGYDPFLLGVPLVFALLSLFEIGFRVLTQHASQMLLTEDDDVIQTFAPHSAMKTLTDRIHPRRAWCDLHDFDIGTLSDSVECRTTLGVAIPNQQLWSGAEWGDLSRLLRRPFLRGCASHASVHNPFRCSRR